MSNVVKVNADSGISLIFEANGNVPGRCLAYKLHSNVANAWVNNINNFVAVTPEQIAEYESAPVMKLEVKDGFFFPRFVSP